MSRRGSVRIAARWRMLERMTIELHQLPAEDFETLVGQTLAARAGETPISLTIESVWRSPYPTARAIPGFSVFLRGPADLRLGQGILSFSHPRHGELALFMTPVGRDAGGFRYEIVFN
jgi:hypothetical protein